MIISFLEAFDLHIAATFAKGIDAKVLDRARGLVDEDKIAVAQRGFHTVPSDRDDAAAASDKTVIPHPACPKRNWCQ